MNRSTCVICGKKRIQSSLKKIFGVWVCNHSRARFNRNSNYLKAKDDYIREFPICQELLFKRKQREIYELWDLYNSELKANVSEDIQYHFVLLA
jgi:hypothetical protein